MFETRTQRVVGPQRVLYDAFGSRVFYTVIHARCLHPMMLTISFQHHDDLRVVTWLIDRVEQDYCGPTGLPLHISDPEKLVMRQMTVKEFQGMDPHQLQELHTRYHLLVTGFPKSGFGFDPTGLATLSSPSRVFSMQGNP